MTPISIQLYSLREQAQKNFIEVIKKVADIGYRGVEPAGLFGHPPGEVRKIVADLGMTVSSNHQPWPNRDNLSEVADVAAELGTSIVTCGFGSDHFVDLETIKKTADTANFIVDRLTSKGLVVVLHNHHWEFDRIDGRIKYDIFMELCPDMQCEIDVYWAANFGEVDPVDIVKRYSGKAPLLHLKDGTLRKEDLQKPLGAGKLDIKSVIAAADPSVLQWLIVELDTSDRDMIQSVRESYDYLIDNGLAKGNK